MWPCGQIGAAATCTPPSCDLICSIAEAAGTDANGKPKDPYYFTFFKEKFEGVEETKVNNTGLPKDSQLLE